LALTPAGALQGVPTATGSVTVRIRVTDSGGASDARDFTLAVGPAVSAASLTGAPGQTNPAQQLPLGLSLSSVYPFALSGTLTLSFSPTSVMPADDPAVQFSTGGRTVNFTIPANTANATFPSQLMLMTGTVAGTITITGGFNNGPSGLAFASVGVRSMAPQISGIVASRVSGGLRVQVSGYSSERRVTRADFVFDVRTSNGIERVTLTKTVEADFGNWYQSAASQPFGSTFFFEQLFTVQGDTTLIEGVTMTLTNGQGSTSSSRAGF
jgi:hypothetical protein